MKNWPKRHFAQTGRILSFSLFFLVLFVSVSFGFTIKYRDYLGIIRGINNAGQVVGSKFISSSETYITYRAFVYSIDKDTVQDLHAPLSALRGISSQALGINNAGQIVGSYLPASKVGWRAFLYSKDSKGKFTMEDLGLPPGMSSAGAVAISNTGQILLACSDGRDSHYFVCSASNCKSTVKELSDLKSTGAYRVYVTAMNDSGSIIGYIQSSNGPLAFRYSGKIEMLDPPNNGKLSIALAVNNAGQIVGDRRDIVGGADVGQAFLYSGGMQDIDTSGAYSSSASSINSAGRVAGQVMFRQADSATRPFLYSKGIMQYLNVRTGYVTNPVFINDSGRIVGYSDDDKRVFIASPDFTTANHNLANVDLLSNQFTLWMDISYKDKADATLCSSYDFKAVSGNTTIAGICKLVNVAAKLAKAKRYRISFTIPPGTSRAVSLTDAEVQACSKKSPSDCEAITELGKISVYGSTFNIEKDAWQVRNQHWKPLSILNPGSDFYKAGDVVSKYIIPSHPKILDQKTFWRLFMTISNKYPLGLCYGLTGSAISNFTHTKEATWATDGTPGYKFDTAKWDSDIGSHWDKVKGKALSPFKPFVAKEIYADKETWNAVDKWTPQAAKKVIYHFVAQSSCGWEKNYWVGKDRDTTRLNSSSAERDVISILGSGTPVSMGIYLTPTQGHQFAITQVLKWSGHTRYTIWDNYYPYSFTKGKSYGPYLSWYVDKSSDYPASFNLKGGNMILATDSLKGIDDASCHYTLTLVRSPDYITIAGDSQNIYNISHTATASEEPKDASTPRLQLPRYPEHMELLIVGARAKVTEYTTGKSVSMGKDGAVSAFRGIATEGAYGLGSSIDLSSEKVYRVSLSRYQGFPSMKAFVTIPNPDGTIEKITYDDITSTKAEFLVGRGSTQSMGSRGTIAPTYRETVPTLIPSPSNFDLAYEHNGVSLTWANPAHPTFTGVKVVRKESTPPESSADGALLYDGPGTSMTDGSAEKGKVFCYAVFPQGGTSEPVNGCIDTTKYSLSGTAPANTTITLRNDQGRIIGHGETGTLGTYRFNNLENGEYLIEVRPNKESEPVIEKAVSIEGNKRMEVR